MKKCYLILFFFCSCNVFRQAQPVNKTVTLNGGASHAATGQRLIYTKWRNVNGTAQIYNPYSLITTAVVQKGTTTFELYGQQTDGQTGKDSMNVIY